MLDIKFIRENPDKVKKACQEKGVKVDIDLLLKIDKKRREKLVALEGFRAEKNKASRRIALAKNKKEKEKIILEMRKFDRKEDKIREDLKVLDNEFQKLMYQIPNLPFDDVPVGKSESDNIVIRRVGKKPNRAVIAHNAQRRDF